MPVRIGALDAPLPIRNTDRTFGAMLCRRDRRALRRRGPARRLRRHRDDRQRRPELRRLRRPRHARSCSTATPTTTSARGCPAARCRLRRRARPTSTREAACSPATRRSTAPPAARRSSPGSPASASRCATAARTAVVEGVGDHGCEYMTGGVVVVLGPHGPELRARA